MFARGLRRISLNRAYNFCTAVQALDCQSWAWAYGAYRAYRLQKSGTTVRAKLGSSAFRMQAESVAAISQRGDYQARENKPRAAISQALWHVFWRLENCLATPSKYNVRVRRSHEGCWNNDVPADSHIYGVGWGGDHHNNDIQPYHVRGDAPPEDNR